MSGKNKNDFFSHNINNYEEDFDDFDNTIKTSPNPILSKFIPSKENREYSTTVYKGFIWIFMALTSFLAVFLIFKIPYYEYYNQTTPIIVGDGGDIVQNPDQNYNDFSALGTLDNYNSSQNNSKSKNNSPNTAIDDAVKTNNNVEKSSNKEEDSTKDSQFLASVSNNNKKSTESSKNLEVNNEDIGDLLLGSNKSNNSSNSTTKDSLVKKGSESDITKILQGNQNTPITNTKVNKTAKELGLPANSIGDPKIEGLAKNQYTAIDIRVVWIVNIFSTINKAVLQDKLTQIISGKENIFNNSTFYFTEYMLNNRKNYRISVVGTKQPTGGIIAYSKQEEALNFCKTLRDNNVDCFVSSINSNLLIPVRK